MGVVDIRNCMLDGVVEMEEMRRGGDLLMGDVLLYGRSLCVEVEVVGINTGTPELPHASNLKIPT